MFGNNKSDYIQPFPADSKTVHFFNFFYQIAGHVLVIPKRVESRLMNLTPEEYNDLFLVVRAVAPKLEDHFGAHAMNIAVQDGVASGQSVPHVHVHILPRKKGDFSRNDDVYDELEQQNLHEVFHPDHRRTKCVDEMRIECDIYKSLFSLQN